MGIQGLQGVTGAYSGLQMVTGPVLLWVTEGYKWLHVVRRDYRGLEEVTGGYKGESIILGKTFINIL